MKHVLSYEFPSVVGVIITAWILFWCTWVNVIFYPLQLTHFVIFLWHVGQSDNNMYMWKSSMLVFNAFHFIFNGMLRYAFVRLSKVFSRSEIVQKCAQSGFEYLGGYVWSNEMTISKRKYLLSWLVIDKIRHTDQMQSALQISALLFQATQCL